MAKLEDAINDETDIEKDEFEACLNYHALSDEDDAIGTLRTLVEEYYLS